MGYRNWSIAKITASFYILKEPLRIKILKKDGFTWADFEIPLYHSGNTDEKLSSFKGATYNLEGEKIVESKIKIGYIQRKA